MIRGLADREFTQKVAEFGDDVGSHSESVTFCESFGFVLSIWDTRIGFLYYQISKEEFLEFMGRYYDDTIMFSNCKECE